MSEEATEQPDSSIGFYDKVDWDLIGHNKISKEDFIRIKAKNRKSYATLLGSQDELQFFMFKPLYWPEYREIKSRGLDKYATQEYIINSCVVWPKLDPISLNTIESGIMLTLVYQILATSFFLNDPNKALEMIIEI
jgi:hypothetical protein